MEAKDYLFQNPDGSWNFGRSKTSPCPAGGYRLDHVEGSETFTIRDRNNRDADVGGTDRSPAEFMDINKAPYANFAAFHTACSGFFFRKLAISQAEADLRYVQFADGEPIVLADLTEPDLLHAMQLLGSEIKILPIGANQLLGGSYTLIDGRSIGQLYVIEKELTITGIGCVQQTQGVYTESDYIGVALFSVAPATGIGTKITETVNDGNLFKAAAGTKIIKAFPAPVTLQPGIYSLAAVWNASATTTSPVLYVHNSIGTQWKKMTGGVLDISFYMDPKASFGTTESLGAGSALSNVTGFWMY